MGKFVAKNVQLEITSPAPSKNLSEYLNNVTLEMTSTAPDVTTFDSDGWMEFIAGLQGWTVSADGLQDFDDGEFDSYMFPRFNTQLGVRISPFEGAVGVNNPYLTGNAIFNSYQVLGAAVGDAVPAPISFQGTGPLARATS